MDSDIDEAEGNPTQQRLNKIQDAFETAILKALKGTPCVGDLREARLYLNDNATVVGGRSKTKLHRVQEEMAKRNGSNPDYPFPPGKSA